MAIVERELAEGLFGGRKLEVRLLRRCLQERLICVKGVE
jgi:hypothetical protein